MGIIRESSRIGPDEDIPPHAPAADPSDNGSGTDGSPDFNIIVGAPDLTQLVKRRQTQNARKYRDQVAGMMKMGVIGSIQTGNFPDAAALLWHGPNAATAMGNLCDSNSRIASAVDMITSPNSPIAETFLTMLPLITQLARNHEKQLAEIPSRLAMGKEARAARKAARAEAKQPAPLTLKIGKRRISIPVRFRIQPKFLRYFSTGVMSQTQEPNLMAANVFTDPSVQRALASLGINIVQPGDGKNA